MKDTGQLGREPVSLNPGLMDDQVSLYNVELITMYNDSDLQLLYYLSK